MINIENLDEENAKFAHAVFMKMLETHAIAAALLNAWTNAEIPSSGDRAQVDLRLMLELGDRVQETVKIHEAWQEQQRKNAPTAPFGLKRAEA